MLELRQVPTPIIGCFGKPAALDQLAHEAALSVRVAPDELLLLAETQRVPELTQKLRGLDTGSLVHDLTAGFATWELRGDSRFEAFCRLSAIPLPSPPAVAQGLVAHVPAKVINGPDALLVIVPSVVSHHLHERVMQACADLQPEESQVASGKSQDGDAKDSRDAKVAGRSHAVAVGAQDPQPTAHSPRPMATDEERTTNNEQR